MVSQPECSRTCLGIKVYEVALGLPANVCMKVCAVRTWDNTSAVRSYVHLRRNECVALAAMTFADVEAFRTMLQLLLMQLLMLSGCY